MSITYKKSSSIYYGGGVNGWTSDPFEEIKPLNFKYVRLWVDTEDNSSAISYDDTQMDALWKNTSKFTSGSISNSYKKVIDNGGEVLFCIGNPPVSWLGPNRLLAGDAKLDAFAKYWTSFIKVATDKGLKVGWIELANEVDGTWTVNVSPQDYFKLVQKVKENLKRRSLNAKIVGPGISHVMKINQTTDDYVTEFNKDKNLLDAWSIHAYEADFSDKYHVQKMLQKDTVQMTSINSSIPIFVTEYGSKKTKFGNIDYGINAPNTTDFAVWEMYNVCGIFENRANATMTWQLTEQSWDPTNTQTLFYLNKTKKPRWTTHNYLGKVIPNGGTIYTSGNTNNLSILVIKDLIMGFVATENKKYIIEMDDNYTADIQESYVFSSQSSGNGNIKVSSENKNVIIEIYGITDNTILFYKLKLTKGPNPVPVPVPTPVPVPVPVPVPTTAKLEIIFSKIN